MKNYFKHILGIFIFFSISAALFSQSLTLVGEAQLSLRGEGVIFSTPSIHLKDNSRLINPENITLTKSDYINITSKDAKIITRLLSKGEIAKIAVGIDGKTNLTIRNTGANTTFIVGMEAHSEADALPYIWKIQATEKSGAESASLAFAWEKEAEPAAFYPKALANKMDSQWLFLKDQTLSGEMASLEDFTEFGPSASSFTVKSSLSDADEDGVPDILEIQQGSDYDDPLAYLDTDGDGVPDYIELIQNSAPLNPLSFLDSNGDGVADYIRDRSLVVLLYASTMQVPWGYTEMDQFLTNSISAILGSGLIVDAAVSWDKADLNIYKKGIYQIAGEINYPRGVLNVYNLSANIAVEILPKPAPLDILLDSDSFNGSSNESILPVGRFEILDPIDDIHEIMLYNEGYDNGLFEIRDNMLYWNSEERAEGRTSFNIIVRVTDRDGNTLDKFFEINRTRMPFEDIRVPNTFTPNGDGINDFWDVRDLRLYQGARIQVFDGGGVRVFYTENPDIGWDGKRNGRDLPIGAYYWVIEIRESGESRKGILNLLRK
ncbi:MAG: gliding motility-associated C-terminal domain-containing protein [Cyclobacterium sp.]|uniref:gliding motility-associated C-terminal domain-containing protein n=1 Tax=unclassified Cyclobacterium TaxID=2615055 RepID=UPI0013D476E2|nr:gliding motility-associated C-terminal domain-containing protein [Cyclobacterium sp. SYSU L10401]